MINASDSDADKVTLVGSILGKAPDGDDGIFPIETVRKLLKIKKNEELTTAVARGKINSLGLRDVEDGKKEREKSDIYKMQARAALEAGEDPVHNPLEYILECIQTIYGIKHKNGAIRRVNVNIAATTVDNYRRLKDAGIGTYILFQETYNKASYETLHPTGPKHNYAYHTEAMDRAMEGGIDDVGLGVLFGLEGYRYEFAAQLMHAEHLEAVFGVGPHTISMPRIKHADDIDPNAFQHGINDDIFAKICACIRLAVPYTGMIISTRESQKVRERLLHLGISQISGASRTSVGGYAEKESAENNSAQFDVSDQRSLDEVVTQEVEDIISSAIVKDSIINNSDCKILLDQRKFMNKFEQIQSLLGLTEKEKSQILSINQSNDPSRLYKEVWIGLGGTQSAVYATEVSTQEYLAYTTEESEKLEVRALAEKLGDDMEAAIRQLAEDKQENK